MVVALLCYYCQQPAVESRTWLDARRSEHQQHEPEEGQQTTGEERALAKAHGTGLGHGLKVIEWRRRRMRQCVLEAHGPRRRFAASCCCCCTGTGSGVSGRVGCTGAQSSRTTG